MPSFLLVRQRCRRARPLSVVRAVAAGWARLGDKSLFHQWWANANRKRAGRVPHRLSVRRDCWDFGSSSGTANHGQANCRTRQGLWAESPVMRPAPSLCVVFWPLVTRNGPHRLHDLGVFPSGLNEPQSPCFRAKRGSATSPALKIGSSQEF